MIGLYNYQWLIKRGIIIRFTAGQELEQKRKFIGSFLIIKIKTYKLKQLDFSLS